MLILRNFLNVMKTVTVVHPTYNEKANIGKTIEKVFEQEKSLTGFQIQIIVADDIRSRDGTEQIVKELINKNKRIHLIKVEPGLGVGLIKGHQYALEYIHPDILAQLDADGQVAPDVLVKLIKAIEEGYSLAIGSRFVSGGKNHLTFIRKIFTYGASLFFRGLVGPWEIREVTNSARAFTPELFNKINFTRLPWKEPTFIIQPAFLHEAILAGAKYKEVPLVFKNRLEGYSKNKVFNYTYDVITYAIDARLHKWGFKIPFFKMSRRAKIFIKFGIAKNRLIGLEGYFCSGIF